MARKDFYHQNVIDSLDNDGWKVTDDPLRVQYGDRTLLVDLGAEPIIGAEKDGQKIAVEIKSFLNNSAVQSLEDAIGQYKLYHMVFERTQMDRTLYLAVPSHSYDGIFSEPLGQLAIEEM